MDSADAVLDESVTMDGGMGESGMSDPTLLENANIDDLFGETADALAADSLAADALGVSLPPLLIPPELGLRIAEMQSRGCCTKLAFSSTGSIAQIEDDGRKIVFRTMVRDPETGTWPLTEESKHAIQASDNARWEHIKFSNLGTDLAAVDSLGRVYIHFLAGPLGKMPLAPHNVHRSDTPKADCDAVVGLYWLSVYPGEFRFPYIAPAIKHGEKWSAPMKLRDTSAPSVHHAVEGRSALLFVSREGRLTLMYQIENVWHAVDIKLEEVNSLHDLLSHAAMGEDGDKILLVTHDLSNRFRLYRIAISWNPAPHSRPGGQQPVTVVAPTLNISRLTMLDHVAPQHADAAKLSHLRIIPTIPSPAADLNGPTFPTVCAIFTRVSFPIDLSQQHQEAFSVISRWHVETAVPVLHEAFSKLKSNKTANISQNTITTLRRQEDIVTNKLVMSIESQYFHTVLAFPASDGSVEFRERTTMTSIEPYPDPTTVTSLPQSGFEHLMDQYYIHIAMSADGSAIALVKTDGTLIHKFMTLRYTWHPVMNDSGLIEAAVVCLARQYAILCSSSVSNDEVLALLPTGLSVELRSIFVKQVICFLGRVPLVDIAMQDANRQQTTATREGLVLKAISAQFVLEPKPGGTERTVACKFSFAFMNMRLVTTSLVQITKQESFLRPDFLIALRGLVKWGSDLLVYIVANITPIIRSTSASAGTSAKEIFDDNVSTQANPAIYLLLCSSTRAFIRFLATWIPKYMTGIQKFMQNPRSVPERQQLAEIFEVGTSLPFRYTDFEAFMAEFDTSIRNLYTHGNIAAERRGDIELALICCDQPIPHELAPALQTLHDSILPSFLEKVDLSELYFWDTAWLGIELSPRAHQFHLDVIRKLPIAEGAMKKLCRRCGAVSENISMERAREMELAPVLVYLGKYCACANYWIIN